MIEALGHPLFYILFWLFIGSIALNEIVRRLDIIIEQLNDIPKKEKKTWMPKVNNENR